MDERNYCCKISTNFLVSAWIVLNSVEYFLFRQQVKKFSANHLFTTTLH